MVLFIFPQREKESSLKLVPHAYFTIDNFLTLRWFHNMYHWQYNNRNINEYFITYRIMNPIFKAPHNWRASWVGEIIYHESLGCDNGDCVSFGLLQDNENWLHTMNLEDLDMFMNIVFYSLINTSIVLGQFHRRFSKA